MRDVREMPETNHGFFFPTASLQEKRKRSDNCYQYFYLHSFVFNGRCRHELREVGIVSRAGVAEIRARLHSFKLKHYLHAPEDLIELILTKLGIGLAEIRPGVNIVNHQLEIVPVDVVIEATQDRIEAVVTLLSGV